jgi:hypothetical protein
LDNGKRWTWIWEQAIGGGEKRHTLLYCGLGEVDTVGLRDGDIRFL